MWRNEKLASFDGDEVPYRSSPFLLLILNRSGQRNLRAFQYDYRLRPHQTLSSQCAVWSYLGDGSIEDSIAATSIVAVEAAVRAFAIAGLGSVHRTGCVT